MKTIITVQVLFYTDFNMVMMLSNDLTNSICKVNVTRYTLRVAHYKCVTHSIL